MELDYFLINGLGGHLHATWDILAFVPNGPGPKSKQALNIHSIRTSTFHPS